MTYEPSFFHTCCTYSALSFFFYSALFDFVPTIDLFGVMYVTASLYGDEVLRITSKCCANVFMPDNPDLVALYELQVASKKQSENAHYDLLYDMSYMEREVI